MPRELRYLITQESNSNWSRPKIQQDSRAVRTGEYSVLQLDHSTIRTWAASRKVARGFLLRRASAHVSANQDFGSPIHRRMMQTRVIKGSKRQVRSAGSRQHQASRWSVMTRGSAVMAVLRSGTLGLLPFLSLLHLTVALDPTPPACQCCLALNSTTLFAGRLPQCSRQGTSPRTGLGLETDCSNHPRQPLWRHMACRQNLGLFCHSVLQNWINPRDLMVLLLQRVFDHGDSQKDRELGCSPSAKVRRWPRSMAFACCLSAGCHGWLRRPG